MHLKLAWRNIWRNPRRTTVILIAIIVGVWTMVFVTALSRGMILQMLETGLKTLTGHIQISDGKYRTDPVVEHSIADPEPVESILNRSLPENAAWTPRIRVNAVVNNARHSAGAILVGIDPVREAKVSFIGTAVAEGRYLEPSDEFGILVGRALLEKFETRVGRKLVLMSQDSKQEIASRGFRIVGAFEAEMKATEEAYLFVSLRAARKMLKLDREVSEVSILLPDISGIDVAAEQLKSAIQDPLIVTTWRERLPLVKAHLDLMNGFILIWYLVVFIAMGFGIVNTLLMAVFERMHEFGILKAVGMKPSDIIRSVLTESFLLLSLGVTIGTGSGILTVMGVAVKGINLSALASGTEYFGISRILYPAIAPTDIVMAVSVVILLGMVVSLYPAIKAARFKPVEALMYT